jgi:hypothetical protein
LKNIFYTNLIPTMVRTRSGAGSELSPKKGKSPSKKISKKESPKKRLLSMNNFTEVVMDFEAPKPPPKICVLPKFTSELQNPTSGQASPSFESSRQCWTPPPPEDQKMRISIPKIDALLSSLQKNAPSEQAGVRRYELFVQEAPIEASTDEILRKWLSKVYRSGMPWIGALSQIPLSLRNQARKIMIGNHARLYL